MTEQQTPDQTTQPEPPVRHAFRWREPKNWTMTDKIYVGVVAAIAAFVAVVIVGIAVSSVQDAFFTDHRTPPPVAAERACGLALVPGSADHNPLANFVQANSGYKVVVQVWTATNGQYVAYWPTKPTFTWCPGSYAHVVGVPFYRAWDGVRPSWCDATDAQVNDGHRYCQARIRP